LERNPFNNTISLSPFLVNLWFERIAEMGYGEESPEVFLGELGSLFGAPKKEKNTTNNFLNN